MEQNILLVDDEEALQMTLGDRLRKEGFAIDCASDGKTGFRKATSLPFDLMILDVMLPGRNGLDLCRDIRLAGLGAPILLLTARPETVYKIVGFKPGADAYVTKPFDMLELVAASRCYYDACQPANPTSKTLTLGGRYRRKTAKYSSQRRPSARSPLFIRSRPKTGTCARHLTGDSQATETLHNWPKSFLSCER